MFNTKKYNNTGLAVIFGVVILIAISINIPMRVQAVADLYSNRVVTALTRQQEWNGAFHYPEPVSGNAVPSFSIGAPAIPRALSMSDDGSVIALQVVSKAVFVGNGEDERRRRVITPGLFISTNGGTSWTERSYGAGYGNTKSLIKASVSGDGRKIFAIQPVYASGINTFCTRRIISYISVHPGARCDPFHWNVHELVVSTNGGESWSSPGALPVATGGDAFADPQVVRYDPNGSFGLYPFSKDGSKLILIARPSGRGDFPGQNPYDTSVWISHNGGVTWTKTLYVPEKSTVPWIEVDFTKPAHSDDGRVIVLTPQGNAATIHYSTDSGVTWRQHTFSDTSVPRTLTEVSADGQKILVGDTYKIYGGGRAFLSIDSGATWVTEDAARARAAVGIHAARIDGNRGKIYFSLNGESSEQIDLPVRWQLLSFDSQVHISRNASKMVFFASRGDEGIRWDVGSGDESEANKIYTYSLSSEKSQILYAPQGTLSISPPGPCTVSAGATCAVTARWSTRNVYAAVLQGLGSLWPSGSNIITPTNASEGTVNLNLPAGTHHFFLSGYVNSSWGSPLATTTYTVVAPEVVAQTVPQTLTPTTTNQLPRGYFDRATCEKLEGWTYDPDESSASIMVDIFDTVESGGLNRSVKIGSYPTSVTRRDVNTNQNITGVHGFSIPTPASLKDGLSHRINAWGVDALGTRRQLSLSPKTLTCSASSSQNISTSTPPATPPTGTISATGCTVGVASSTFHPNNAKVCDSSSSWSTTNATNAYVTISGTQTYSTASHPYGAVKGIGLSGQNVLFWTTPGNYTLSLYVNGQPPTVSTPGTGTKVAETTITVSLNTTALSPQGTTNIKSFISSQVASVLQALESLLQFWR